jgi:hypothetical protein
MLVYAIAVTLISPAIALGICVIIASRFRLWQEMITTSEWKIRFAWLPSRLIDGRVAWLCRIEERPIEYFQDGLGLYGFLYERRIYGGVTTGEGGASCTLTKPKESAGIILN